MVSINGDTRNIGWFIMERPIKLDEDWSTTILKYLFIYFSDIDVRDIRVNIHYFYNIIYIFCIHVLCIHIYTYVYLYHRQRYHITCCVGVVLLRSVLRLVWYSNWKVDIWGTLNGDWWKMGFYQHKKKLLANIQKTMEHHRF